MYEIIYSDEAKINILNIVDYIWKDYSLKVILNITKTASLLEHFPEMWFKISKWEREIVESKYKYQIRYAIIWKEINILLIYKFKNIKWR
jgi:hypothetical protein